MFRSGVKYASRPKMGFRPASLQRPASLTHEETVPWSVTVTENFQTGAYDQSPGPGTGTNLRIIGHYDVWNVGLAYAGFRNWTLSGGIKNLLDRDPPFSNQTQSFQVGYDPTYADPHGRVYWLGVRYAFR